MIVSSRYLSVAAACLLAVTLVACGDNDANPSSPSPTAPGGTPAPGSSATAYTISGTVAETAPTLDRLLDGVTVSTEGRSVTTDSAGRFTMTDLPAGTYILRASRGGYTDGVTTATLPADAGRTFQFNLEPGLDRQTRERSGRVGPDSPTCGGSAFPCARYDFPSHHEDDVEITLLWDSSDASFRLEFRCGGEAIATQTQLGGSVSRDGNEWVSMELTSRSRKGQMCEARALHLGGQEQRYVLIVSHPN